MLVLRKDIRNYAEGEQDDANDRQYRRNGRAQTVAEPLQEKYSHSRLKDLRHWLGINVNKLHALYRFESLLIANTQASHRLDTNDKPLPGTRH